MTAIVRFRRSRDRGERLQLVDIGQSCFYRGRPLISFVSLKVA